MPKPLDVLLIEDSEADALLLILELERGGYAPRHQRVDTPNGLQAALDQQTWDVILADYSMPQFTITDALSIVQTTCLDIPFIIVSGSIGEEIAVTVMKAGAHDYILKDNLTRLVATVERELREAQVRAEHKQAFETIQYLAFYDSLTGLLNRTSFLHVLQQCIDQQQEQPSPFAVLLIEIDRYQTVKYSLGHGMGEQFLIAIARKLQACIPPPSVFARVGTDEFAILFNPGLGSPTHDRAAIAAFCDRIRQALIDPFDLSNSKIFATYSIGIAPSTTESDQADALLQAADTAKHYAKLRGKSEAVWFTADMQDQVIARLELETDLQHAIQQQRQHPPHTEAERNNVQLSLHYQPIVNLTQPQLLAVEALARWHHPQRGHISPVEFIPVAEETGLITELGRWVLEEACSQLSHWKQLHSQYSLPRISVNLSAKQLSQHRFVAMLDESLQRFGLQGTDLELEITESVLMENAGVAATLLTQLKERGIQISIDDFGTGYSSLSYLTTLPIDAVKIDRSFIQGMVTNDQQFSIVKAIVAMAHTLKLAVVAEGIETLAQVNCLRSLGCESGQGYLFSRPLTPIALTQILKNSTDFNQALQDISERGESN
ncbi:MAG: GGDEF domain-containing response regulator [Leptolyngbyaceae cyanobacterium SL_7_1]|nr:GGDEF domain-containing response regulator [Leptolyngbyaceae cyanobacterium SL_7_1]